MLLESTTLATLLRYVADSLRQDYGLDPAPLFQQAGISLARTRESGSRVAQGAARQLWELAITATGDPAIGLKVGRRIRPEGMHALGYAWMSSRTLADALQRFARYAQVLVTIPANVTVTSVNGSCQLTAVFPDPAQRPHEAGIDTTLVALLALGSKAAGHPVRPRAVFLEHPCRTQPAVYAAAFGIPVEFGAAMNGIRFDHATAEAVLPTDNPDIASVLDQVADRYVASLQPQPVAATVRTLLRELLPTGEVGQATVASRLNCSLSTLQRQLQAEGLNYRTVLDETRRSLAEAYLRDARFTQAEIAYLLGFSDQSNFSRAYRRWTGRSPGQFSASQIQ
ncbi:MAG: AraC family transcriptional regulator [Chromatiales bacterium]|nr:AraC family transcriptional regulator [Chromatiales bacterium]